MVPFSPLADADILAARAAARAWAPPPPADLNAWAADNVRFGEDSPLPGKYDPEKFPFFRRILEVLGPEHAAREVVLKKSAQLGGTVLAQIFIGGSMDLVPGPMMYVHPTDNNGTRWVKTKWKSFVRNVVVLRRVFVIDRGRDGGNSLTLQERRDGRGQLVIGGANSPASLSMLSIVRQVQDDLAKWELNSAGDPEDQADSRSKAFSWAKIFKISTPLIRKSCRITRTFEAGTQEHWHVPCPHCGHEQPLLWENMLAALDEERPEEAHFTCVSCEGEIGQNHRAAIVRQGRWVAHNPKGRYPSFYLWSAYSPLEEWAAIAQAWLDAKGDPSREQTFANDWVGNAYEAASEAPPWEDLRDRAKAGHQLRRIPVGGLLLCAGADCQVDRVEVQVVAFGADLKRWVVDYRVIEGHISEDKARSALDDLLKDDWPDAFGNRRALDHLCIDAGYAKTDVVDWAKRHPRNRVIPIRGVPSDLAPEIAPGRPEFVTKRGKRQRLGTAVWAVGQSPLKASFYKQLAKADPAERGHVGLPAGLDDEYYRQLTAERRAKVKSRGGYEEWRWVKDPGQPNEGLDTMIYAEAGAIRIGWKKLDEAGWDQLRAKLEVRPAPRQGDLLEPDTGLYGTGRTVPADEAGEIEDEDTDSTGTENGGGVDKPRASVTAASPKEPGAASREKAGAALAKRLA